MSGAQRRRSGEAFQSRLRYSDDVKARIVEAVETAASAVRERSLDAVPGLTCDQVEVVLNLIHQTASAEIRHLVQAGLLVDSGAKRKTRTGCKATVWTIP